MKTNSYRSKSSGATLVEFSLVAALFFAMIFAIFEFGFFLRDYSYVTFHISRIARHYATTRFAGIPANPVCPLSVPAIPPPIPGDDCDRLRTAVACEAWDYFKSNGYSVDFSTTPNPHTDPAPVPPPSPPPGPHLAPYYLSLKGIWTPRCLVCKFLHPSGQIQVSSRILLENVEKCN